MAARRTASRSPTSTTRAASSWPIAAGSTRRSRSSRRPSSSTRTRRTPTTTWPPSTPRRSSFREALAEYLTALKLEPDSATAHYNLACFLSTHATELAIAEYKEAIELDPEYPDAHLNLGLTYADVGRVRRGAWSELKTAIELDPADAFPRHELAALQMDEGDYRAAITQLKEVVRLEPENFEAQLDLGICYAQKGFYAEAERAYEKAQGAPRRRPAAHTTTWARSTRSGGASRRRIEHLKKAVAIDATKVRRGWRPTRCSTRSRATPEFERCSEPDDGIRRARPRAGAGVRQRLLRGDGVRAW